MKGNLLVKLLRRRLVLIGGGLRAQKQMKGMLSSVLSVGLPRRSRAAPAAKQESLLQHTEFKNESLIESFGKTRGAGMAVAFFPSCTARRRLCESRRFGT